MQFKVGVNLKFWKKFEGLFFTEIESKGIEVLFCEFLLL